MTVTYLLFFSQTSELNFDYYINTHMRMTSETLGTDTIISWEVFRLPKESPYCAMVKTEWPSKEVFEVAVESKEAEPLHADLINCSKEKPLILFQEFVGSSELVFKGNKK